MLLEGGKKEESKRCRSNDACMLIVYSHHMDEVVVRGKLNRKTLQDLSKPSATDLMCSYKLIVKVAKGN